MTHTKPSFASFPLPPITAILVSSLLLTAPSCTTTVTDGGTSYTVSNEKGESVLDSRLRRLDEEVKLYPKRHDLYYDMAGIYYEKQDFRAAARALEKAIELEPTNVQYQTMLGRVYLLMQEVELAEQHFRKAVSLVPPGRYSGPHAALGYVLSLKKDYAGAIEEFKKCLIAEPYNPKFYYSLGAQYDIMGNREEAIRYFQGYLQSGDTEYRKHVVFLLGKLGVDVRPTDLGPAEGRAAEGRVEPAASSYPEGGKEAFPNLPPLPPG